MKAAILAGLAAAQAFAPRVSPGAFDAPTACYYRVLPAPEGRARILYWLSWPDERHPLSFIDAPYRAFRRLYYGSTADLEYVLVEGDAKTGAVTRMAFQSAVVGRIFVNHITHDLTQGIPAAGSHPLLTVGSWNHLFEPGANAAQEVPLQEMDDARYASLRMARRSLPPEAQ